MCGYPFKWKQLCPWLPLEMRHTTRPFGQRFWLVFELAIQGHTQKEQKFCILKEPSKHFLSPASLALVEETFLLPPYSHANSDVSQYVWES